jgi:radical SAM superfamily enzyme YgiQ (UPF0313 family)
VSSLKDQDILWSDYVFIGAMSVQQDSTRQIIDRCRKLDRKIVAGGPLFTGEPENYSELVDHLVLNEAEITLPLFLNDLHANIAGKIYRTDKHPEMDLSPIPDYSLIDVTKYAQLNIQYSRGCPYNCEFCEITALLGHRFRIKSTERILEELENIYETGFRGNVFFVDDNFIGNRKKLKQDLLPAMIRWAEERDFPLIYTTEASINLADDPELMDQMVQAGFVRVFVGIETPDEAGLEECNKTHNQKRNLIDSVNQIQSQGMEVTAGFIVGFDSDTPEIFQRQIDFIQESGIITAMVGMLNAPNNTRLFQRLSEEGRIVDNFSGNNTNYSMNFIPKMDRDLLMKGYQTIIQNIYSSKAYYERVVRFLKAYTPKVELQTRITYGKIMALMRSVLHLGIINKSRVYYWKLFFWSLFNRPDSFSLAITYSIYGYHFRKVFRNVR